MYKSTDELKKQLEGPIKDNIKTKFETEKLGLSLADTITEYIRKDLNLNFKGFILNSKNSLKNFIQQKINERYFPENKQAFIYEKMKEILQASKVDNYVKKNNFDKLHDLSFNFADEFKDFI